jgi:hypothetical protein
MLPTGSCVSAAQLSTTLLVFGIAVVTAGGCAESGVERSGDCPANYHRSDDRRCYLATNGGSDAVTIEDTAGDETDWSPYDSTPDSERDQCQPYDGVIEFTEIHANPDGPDGGAEFVELLVTPSPKNSLRLEALSADSDEAYWQTALSFEDIEAEPELVRVTIGHELTDEVPINCSSANGCIQNGPDALQVVDCSDTVVARLEYPALPSNRAFARCELPDSNDADQFALASPTPNESTRTFDDEMFCALPCLPDRSSDVFIEQLFINPAGSDGGREFVVIRHEGPHVSSDLSITGRDGVRASDWLPSFAIGSIAPSSRLVVGGDTLAGSDIKLGSSIQNGPDGFELTACGSTVIDTVVWADEDTELLGEPDIPLPLDHELWVRCPGYGWVSGIFGDDEVVEPLDQAEIDIFCTVDDEFAPWEDEESHAK